jgi:putative molybdopterin biosynthesis protein
MTSPMLKSKDVAAILNISRRTVYTLMQRGELPSVRIGRSVRVQPEDLENFISNSISVGPVPLDQFTCEKHHAVVKRRLP